MADATEEKKPRRGVWGNPNKPIQEEFDEPEVQMNTDYSNIIIVDNIPVVEEAKVEKLAGVLRKLFSAFGEIQDFHIPQEATGDKKTLGYAFFEYRTPEEAARAVAERDNTKLDKAHTLRVNVYSDLEKFKAVPDKFEHKLDTDQNVDIKSLLSFLLDPEGRDQFCLRYGHETEIWWNDVQKKPQNFRDAVNRGEAHTSKGKHWTDLYTAWSPKGTYLATYHVQGIVLWGGDKFEKIQRFSHPGVKLMDFSPCENYIVTCNTMEAQGPNDPECIIVWDVRTGQKLRGFDSGGSTIWPAFVWSSDDKYLARIARDKSGKEAIFVYEAPDMGLLDKQSIKTPGARDLLWSPSDNILSYWVPEENNIPAKVSLIEIPSKKQVRERHLYNVTDIKLRWHNKGEFLMVKMSRQKKGKVVSTIFEMFRMRQKEIPVEVLELEDNVIAFAWEPNGQRFAIIHETAPNQNNVSFFSVKKKKIEKINTLEKRAANFLYWSPQGSQILLAGLAPNNGAPANNMNGQLEFYDVDLQDTAATREHFKCTDIEWDPTGRYVITSVCQAINSAESWKYGTENGYRIWAYDGKGEGVWAQRSNQQVEYFYQALWRPRPASCLTKDQIANIRTNLRDKYWKKFEQEDEKLRTSLLTADAQARVKQRDEWKAYRSERIKEYREEAQDRAALRGGVMSDDEGDIETTEELQEVEIGEPEIVVVEDEDDEDTGSRRNSKRRDDDE